MNYQQLASQGRYGDTTMVHMTPQEVAGLNALGAAYGRPMTINPTTGYPEAFNLKNLFPALIGAGLNIATGGALTPLQVGLATGAGYTLATGDPMKGLTAGFGAAGGAGIGEGLTAAGSTAMPIQGASTMGESFARAGQGIKALGTEQGLDLFMGAPATAATPATGVGGLGGLTKSSVMALTPEMTDIQMPTPPEDVSYIRPYSLEIDNVSGTPFSGSSERQQLTYRFKEEEPYRVAQGGHIKRYQEGGSIYSGGNLAPNDSGGYTFTYKSGATQSVPGDNLLGLYDLAGRLEPSQIDPSVQKTLAGYTPQQRTADLRSKQLDINKDLRQQQASGMELSPDELTILRAADEGTIITSPEELTAYQNRPPPPPPMAVPQFRNTTQDVYQNIANVQRMAGLQAIDVPTMNPSVPAQMIQPQSTGAMNYQPINYGINVPSPEQSTTYQSLNAPPTNKFGLSKFGSGSGGGDSDIVGYTSAGQPVYSSLSSVPNLDSFAEGGLANLREGRFLRGDGDGMSDEIPASIEGEVDALLSDGEFVIPADVVSHLGNGSSEAGAKVLYEMMDRIRHERTGNKDQAKEVPPEKVLPV